MNVSITFPGTSSGMIESDRYFSSYFLALHSQYLLLDCNEQSARWLFTSAQRNPDMDLTVCLSHAHPDHINGIPVLLQMFYILKRSEPLTIVVPGYYRPMLERLLPHQLLIPERMPFPLIIKTWEAEPSFEVEGLTFSAIQNTHVDKYAIHVPELNAKGYSFLLENKQSGKKALFSMDIKDDSDILSSQIKNPHFCVLDGSHLSSEHIQNVVDIMNPDIWMVSHYHSDVKSRYHDNHLAHDGQEIEIAL